MNVCNQHQLNLSKPLTLANQSGVPIKQCNSVNCISSIETRSKNFMSPVAVADIKFLILGTPILELYIQKFNNQDLTMSFKFRSIDQPTNVFFTA